MQCGNDCLFHLISFFLFLLLSLLLLLLLYFFFLVSWIKKKEDVFDWWKTEIATIIWMMDEHTWTPAVTLLTILLSNVGRLPVSGANEPSLRSHKWKEPINEQNQQQKKTKKDVKISEVDSKKEEEAEEEEEEEERKRDRETSEQIEGEIHVSSDSVHWIQPSIPGQFSCHEPLRLSDRSSYLAWRKCWGAFWLPWILIYWLNDLIKPCFTISFNFFVCVGFTPSLSLSIRLPISTNLICITFLSSIGQSLSQPWRFRKQDTGRNILPTLENFGLYINTYLWIWIYACIFHTHTHTHIYIYI